MNLNLDEFPKVQRQAATYIPGAMRKVAQATLEAILIIADLYITKGALRRRESKLYSQVNYRNKMKPDGIGKRF